MSCRGEVDSGPLLDRNELAEGCQLAGPAPVSTVAPQDLLDRASAASPPRPEMSDRPSSPDNREPLPPVLDGIEEVREIAGRIGRADFGHKIRLSDLLGGPG